MRIASVASQFEHDAVEDIEFRSETSALDFDILIWDPNYLVSEYPSALHSQYRGCPSLDSNDSARIIRDIDRRKREISEMLKLGRTVVILMPQPETFYVDTGSRQYSGTGKSRQTTIVVNNVRLLDALPIKVKTIEAKGKSLDFCGTEIFSSFWQANKNSLFYRAYFEEPLGIPLFKIKGTNKVVGSYINVDNGNLLFLPDFEANEEDYGEVSKRFIDSLMSLINELKKSVGDFALPQWSNVYVTPQEVEQKSQLQSSESDLSDILSKISKQKQDLQRTEEMKILFTGSGRALEVQVRRVFEELGFEAAEGAPGRDDLILIYKDRIAVVEIKGVTKSAAEKHAAQLEKWVSEYYSSNGIKPKGILVVNSYKDTPLQERTEPTFPNQMLKYSVSREHCLVTGVQLLGVFLDSKQDETKKEQIIDDLFNNNGIFDQYQNWVDYLAVVQETMDIEAEP